MTISHWKRLFNNCRLNVLRFTTRVRSSSDRVLCDARGGSDGIGECHTNPVLRSQDDHRASFNGLPRSQLKIVFSEQIAQNHEDLQHRVISADTASRSGSEGKKGEGCAQLFACFGETLRIEVLRILPVARSMVRTVHIHNDHRSAGYGEVAYAVVRNSHAVDHPKRGVEAQRLHNYLSRKFELGNVGVRNGCVSEHGGKLPPHLLETIRTRAQKIKKPR